MSASCVCRSTTRFVGTLESYRDGDIVVRDGEGAHPVEKKNIALCRIEFDFEG